MEITKQKVREVLKELDKSNHNGTSHQQRRAHKACYELYCKIQRSSHPNKNRFLEMLYSSASEADMKARAIFESLCLEQIEQPTKERAELLE